MACAHSHRHAREAFVDALVRKVNQDADGECSEARGGLLEVRTGVGGAQADTIQPIAMQAVAASDGGRGELRPRSARTTGRKHCELVQLGLAAGTYGLHGRRAPRRGRSPSCRRSMMKTMRRLRPRVLKRVPRTFLASRIKQVHC